MASPSSSLSSYSLSSIPIISPPSSSNCKSPCSHLLNLKTSPFPILHSFLKTLPNTTITSSPPPLFHPSLSLRSQSHARRFLFHTHAAASVDSVPHSPESLGEEKENEQDAVQTVESDADLKSLRSVDELIKVYRDAVLAGNDKAISDIETKLYEIENQKNELVHRLFSLQAEMTSGKEKYIRLQADFDNFRKRSDKEKLTITSDAKGEVMESLLAMVDSFEKARQQIKTETEKEEKIDKSYLGIYKQFVEVLRSLNVSAVPAVGKPFDPSMHEAVAREASEEFKTGIVIQEILRGFRLGDRILRPATVKVSSGPAKAVQSAPPEKPEQGSAAVDES